MLTALSLGMDALAYGMTLFVICIGLSVNMGLMRVVNLAHGAFAMVGGYLAAILASRMGVDFFVATFLAVVATAALALPLERLLYRRIYGASELTQVLMTIGITFVLIGAANWLMGPSLATVPLPPLLQGTIDLGFRSLVGHKVLAIVVGVIAAASLWLVFNRTNFGIHLRATVDDPTMAQALGINTGWIYAIAFVIGVGLAALGGVIGAQLLPIEPYYALRHMVAFLVVVAVGGAGSIGGTLIASLLLALVEVTARYLAPDFGDFFFYLAVIAIVAVFPNGLVRRLG